MIASRWPDIERLYFEARDLAPGDRAALLDTACQGEPELRLAAGGQQDRFLDQPPAQLVANLLEQTTPERIGPYAILRVLGEGGMVRLFVERVCKGRSVCSVLESERFPRLERKIVR